MRFGPFFVCCIPATARDSRVASEAISLRWHGYLQHLKSIKQMESLSAAAAGPGAQPSMAATIQLAAIRACSIQPANVPGSGRCTPIPITPEKA